MKTKVGLTLLLVCAAVLTGVVFAEEPPTRDPYPISGIWWVCHEVEHVRFPLAVTSQRKLDVHLAHGDWFTDEDGTGCTKDGRPPPRP